MSRKPTPKKKPHGGPRPGAGRKPIGTEPMIPVEITLPPDLAHYFRHIGNGDNLSLGIRTIGQRYRAIAGKHPRCICCGSRARSVALRRDPNTTSHYALLCNICGTEP